jgi:hypothetical protein
VEILNCSNMAKVILSREREMPVSEQPAIGIVGDTN